MQGFTNSYVGFGYAVLTFSPDSTAVALTRWADGSVGSPSDIWTVSLVSGAIKRLTSDGQSLNPVWGSKRIAFARWSSSGAHGEHVTQVWAMNPDGTDQRQLTHGPVGAWLTGTFPLDWSADGASLLAAFGGSQGVCKTTVIAVPRGSTRYVNPPSPGQQLIPRALSADGSLILGELDSPPNDGDGRTAQGVAHANLGQVCPGPGTNNSGSVVVVPSAGGRPITLASHAVGPDWNR